MTGEAHDPKRALCATSPWLGLALGLVAAGLLIGVIQAVHPIFRVGKEFDVPSIGMPTELFLAHRREQDKVDRQHAMSYLGGLGLLMTLALGAREALARRFWLAPLLGAPLGIAGGAIGGLLGSMVFVYVRNNIGQAELNHTIGTQLAIGLPLGFGIGLGAGLAKGTLTGVLKSASAGLAAGGLAAALYPVLISLALPGASTDSLLPDQISSRVLWLGLLGGSLGWIIPVAGRQRTKPSPP
jgi:hypothetical protein